MVSGTLSKMHQASEMICTFSRPIIFWTRSRVKPRYFVPSRKGCKRSRLTWRGWPLQRRTTGRRSSTAKNERPDKRSAGPFPLSGVPGIPRLPAIQSLRLVAQVIFRARGTCHHPIAAGDLGKRAMSLETPIYPTPSTRQTRFQFIHILHAPIGRAAISNMTRLVGSRLIDIPVTMLTSRDPGIIH